MTGDGAILAATGRSSSDVAGDERGAPVTDQAPARLSLRQRAQQAEKIGDMDAALLAWGAFRDSDPNNPLGYIAALRVTRQHKRFDLAAALLSEGLGRLPGNVDLLVAGARLAEARKRAEDADVLWQKVVAARPDDQEFSLAAAITLTVEKKGRRKRMPIVLQRLTEHHRRFPAHVAAYRHHIDALRLAERLVRARALATEWCARFPDDEELALARVALFEDEGDLPDALAQLEKFRGSHGPSVLIDTAMVRVLSIAGRHADAERMFEEANARSPAERKLWLEYARVASRQGDWPEVERRLLRAKAELPNDNQITRELGVARQLLLGTTTETEAGTSDVVGAASQPTAEVAPEAPSPVSADAALMSRFESLGGTIMGCEFGMLQRQLGNDVVSLLRWSETNPPELIKALDCEFEGVGDLENTELRTAKHGLNHEEYVTRDKRFLMASHTFVYTTAAPADRMLQQSCRRIRFLAGKLIEVLREGGKIFVYRAQAPIDDPMILGIHKAVARYGDNALLCIKRADDHNTAGSLRTLTHGVYVGYVSHFRNERDNGTGSDLVGWMSACRQADAAWQATRASRQAAA